MLCDVILEGSGMEDQSMNYSMLLNILHAEKPEGLFKEVYRILMPEGELGIIHWNYDPEKPRGPPMNIRPRPEQCIKWAGEAGFKFENKHDLNQYHYGLIFSRPVQK